MSQRFFAIRNRPWSTQEVRAAYEQLRQWSAETSKHEDYDALFALRQEKMNSRLSDKETTMKVLWKKQLGSIQISKIEEDDGTITFDGSILINARRSITPQELTASRVDLEAQEQRIVIAKLKSAVDALFFEMHS